MQITRRIRKLLLLPIRKIQFNRFGNRSEIIKPLLISGTKNISVGNRTTIREFARIEAINSFCGDRYNPKLRIEDHVTIEQGAHITCCDTVVIGEDTTISSYVYISDTSHTYKTKQSVLDQPLEVKPVLIGKSVFIGTGAKILPGVSIGDGSIIGANAVVTHNIPPNSVAVGVPAKVIKTINRI